mmetsp:Transcript_36618/g.80227  ORF Transcript_36618/g.80227 Transcript_36618/m.80227 type:complete len:291 (-) Transcript_36618:40-912(-)
MPLGPGFTTTDHILWAQRIDKEVAALPKNFRPPFSLRNAVMVQDVPTKFKPGHLSVEDFESLRNSRGFEPKRFGWDPEGQDAREFRRIMHVQRSQPQQHFSYPETSSQEMAWALTSLDCAGQRLRRRPAPRLGIGWDAPTKDAVEDSGATTVSAAAPSEVPKATAPAASTLSVVAPSTVSQTVGSAVQGNPPVRSQNPPRLAGATELSAAAPTRLSRTSSVPTMLLKSDPARWLELREKRVGKATEELKTYSVNGRLGRQWGRPLGETDATAFQNEFTRCTRLALHQYSR